MARKPGPINKHYGDWTVNNPDEPLDPADGKNTKIWCTCKCGNQHRVLRAGLRAGTTQSCTDCKKRRRTQRQWNYDLAPHKDTDHGIGSLHGRLEVISNPIPTDVANGKRNRTVLVRCTCNTELEVAITNLLSGNTKSCGCYHREGLQQLLTREPIPYYQ